MDDGWLESRLAGNGTADRGGFTEAYLTEEGFTQEARKREVGMAWRVRPPTVDLAIETARRGSGRWAAAMTVVHVRIFDSTHAAIWRGATWGLSPVSQRPILLQNELPEQLANASNTIAWWQSRQAEVQDRLSKRRAAPSLKPADQGSTGSKKAGSGKSAAVNGKAAAVNGKAAAVNGKAAGVNGKAAGVNGKAAGVNGKAAVPKIAVLGKLAPLPANGNGNGNGSGGSNGKVVVVAPAEAAHDSSMDEAEEGSMAVEAAAPKKKAATKGLQAVFELVGVGKK